MAAGGTLFLDEIGDMSLQPQAKLLRVLQEGTYEALGGVLTIKADVRVLAATNRDLTAIIREGSFREDLYYRHNIFELRIPPLRERMEDIPILVDHFTHRLSAIRENGIRGIAPKALRVLMGLSIHQREERSSTELLRQGCVETTLIQRRNAQSHGHPFPRSPRYSRNIRCCWAPA